MDTTPNPPPPPYQEWEDQGSMLLNSSFEVLTEFRVNRIVMDGDSWGCHYPETVAITYRAQDHDDLDTLYRPPNQPVIRATITLCDHGLQNPVRSFDFYSPYTDFTKVQLDELEAMIAFHVIHEKIRLLVADQENPIPGSYFAFAYGWAAVRALNGSSSLGNPDNYAFFATVSKAKQD
ncbi:MAG: hypothetical protein Q9227_002034 [Pyrenula ochraceoflavens]